MTSASTRPLQLWEQIGFSMNISTCVDLQGRGVNSETVTRAFQALQQEHPYLRMGVEYQDNVAKFVEVRQATLALTTAATLYPNWRTKLQEFANEFRDWSEAIVFAELASNGEQHQLFLTVNHAGIDAVGLLHLCDSLLANLSKASQGQAIAAKPERNFRDIFTNMEQWQPMSITKGQARPDIPAQYMPALSPDRVMEVVSEPHLAAIWSELDDNWTQALISRCKENGVTVQAAISAASMLAMAKAQAHKHPLPQNILIQAPINMRSQVGVSPSLEAEECVCAVSYLWWCQQLSSEDRLWAVVAKSSAALKQEKSKKSGLAFWSRVHKDFYSPPYTVNASSWGVSPVKPTYGPLTVNKQHVMVATFGLVKPDDATVMTHAHTFNGRLHTVFTFSKPGVSQDLGQDMARWQQQVLKKLAAPDSDDALVSHLLSAEDF